MHLIKHLSVALALLLMLLTLSACQAKPDTSTPVDAPTVYSNQRDGRVILQPGEFPYYSTDDSETIKRRFNAYVTDTYDGIFVEGETYTTYNGGLADYASHRITYICGKWKGDTSGVYLDGELVIDGVCVGFLSSPHQDTVLIFINRDDSTLVYGATLNGETWTVSPQPLVSAAGNTSILYLRWHSSNMDCPDFVYVVTDQTVARFTVGDFVSHGQDRIETVTVREYTAPDYWEHVHPNSVTLMGDYFFIGGRFGVTAMNVETGDFYFYPINISNS